MSALQLITAAKANNKWFFDNHCISSEIDGSIDVVSEDMFYYTIPEDKVKVYVARKMQDHRTLEEIECSPLLECDDFDINQACIDLIDYLTFIE